MQTFKKKNIKDFKVVLETKCTECETRNAEVVEEEEEIIDELVTSTGGEISGDEKNVNNSEIKTAPQNTTDQFNAMAIQPNRYLYGVTGSAYSAGARQGTMEAINKIAKDKLMALLESEMDIPVDDNTSTTNNKLSQSMQRKVNDLIKTVEVNNLKKEPQLILEILSQVLDGLVPMLDNNNKQILKDKLNA